MKLPLKIIDMQHIVNAETIYIADAGAAIVCSLPIEEREFAQTIVEVFNAMDKKLVA